MIHSSRRDRKAKAIAEALAMLADAHTELEPHRRRPVRETDEWLWESATEFCAALDRYAGRAHRRHQIAHGGPGNHDSSSHCDNMLILASAWSGEASTLMRLIAAAHAREPKV